MAARKLTKDEQFELVKRIAWFWRDVDITKFLKDNFGKSITAQTIQEYRKAEHWKLQIESFRDKYLNEVNAVACANKRVRLEELQKHYDQMVREGNTKDAVSILKEFREEMEKKIGDNVSFNFTQVNNTQYNQLTDAELADEINKTVKQLERANGNRVKGVLSDMGSKESEAVKEA
jgi:hypothetical protein